MLDEALYNSSYVNNVNVESETNYLKFQQEEVYSKSWLVFLNILKGIPNQKHFCD